VATIMAQRFAAPLLDRYLARTGFGSQQSAEKEPTARPDNLWEPADEAPGEDRGAHGEFDERSHPRSEQEWAAERAGSAASAVARAAGGIRADKHGGDTS
jgi:hypothetical protein